MNKCKYTAITALAVGAISLAAAESAGPETKSKTVSDMGTPAEPASKLVPSAAIPKDRLEEPFWQKRHAAIVEKAKKGDVDLLMIGDSIVHSFDKAVWDKYYAPRRALNLGYWGDKTENVLWRLDHGEIDGISPKLAIVMIGTNNTSTGNTPEEIYEGVKAICGRLRAKLPETKIMLLAIFARGKDAADKRRINNEAANKLIAGLADNENIFFVDINDQFVEKDGTLRKDLFPDLLHPKEKGCAVWAEAIEPYVARFMGDEAKK